MRYIIHCLRCKWQATDMNQETLTPKRHQAANVLRRVKGRRQRTAFAVIDAHSFNNLLKLR